METPLNHFFNERSYPRTLDALMRGPLAAHLKTYAQQLRDEGYAVQTGQYQLRMLGHFNRWLQIDGLAADEIDSSTVKRFVRSREKTGKLRKGDTAALARLLRMLRAGQTEVPSSPPTACQTVLQSVSALLAARARIIRGDDYAPDACRKRASGGVFSD